MRRAATSERRGAIDQLRRSLVAGRNADGGWGYYAGKASRLEPTCWALLALHSGLDSGTAAPAVPDPALAWLAGRQQPSGWLVEHADWPVNIAFNALAAFTLHQQRDLVPAQLHQRLLAAVVASKGSQAAPAPNTPQDNTLQGWSWIDATFSWVEPTCWGLLALKRTRGAGLADASAGARIAEAERLLIDRTCRPGGWNYGNSVVMQQDLRPYGSTTALGLLAMQNRRDEDAVIRSLATLETLWPDERSATALGLSLVCLDLYERPANPLLAQLIDHTPNALAFGNYHGIAVALFALSSVGQAHVFRI